MKLHLTALLVSGLLPLPLAAQDDASPQANQPAATNGAKSEFGSPLVVNGERIPDAEIKRALVYGPGRALLDVRKIEILMEQELELREAMGEDVSVFALSDEEFQRVYDQEIAEFQERYPMLDLETEIERAYRTREWYVRQLRQTLAFDKLFFPGEPNSWPEMTKEAIHAGAAYGQEPGVQVVDLVEDAQKAYERRKEFAEENGVPMQPEDDMFLGLIRDYVIQSLESLVSIQTAADGLPPELAMVVEGGGFRKEVATDEIYAQAKSAFTQRDLADTRLFLALARATADALDKEGVLVSEEEHRAKVAELTADLKYTMFNIDFLALQGHQFPSMEAYKEYLRLLESFRAKMEPQMAPMPDGGLSPVLREHLNIANRVMGLAKADAEIILVSAYDFLNDRWKDRGWEWAEQEAARLKKEIDDHLDELIEYEKLRAEAAKRGENLSGPEPLAFDRYWGEMLDLHSEFWDPPMPATGRPISHVGMTFKGRFGENTRNDLERAISESPYYQLLTNRSIVDTIFFDMEPGSVAGPFEGPEGYYIVYLRRRSAVTNPLRPSEPKHVELLREDWLRREFITYAHKALEMAEVKGL